MDDIKSIRSVFGVSKEIEDYLLKEGFSKKDPGRYYAGVQGQILFCFYMEGINDEDSYVCVVTSDEIGISVEYPYGSGYSGGRWSFYKNDFESFTEAYNNFVNQYKTLIDRY